LTVEFRILGPLEVRSESGAVALGGIKPRAVLALLLLNANQSVHAERLALALWGEDAPARAVKTVHVYVSRLRKALGDADVLATTPAGYSLRVRPGELDAERFTRLVEDGRRALDVGQAERAAAVLREALALWRGPPLAELAYEPFAQAEIARLEDQRLSALEARMDCELQLGEHATVIAGLESPVADNLGREKLAAQLMLALYRCGRQGEALDVYARTHAYLSGELGLEPGPALRTLQARILAQSPALQHLAKERLATGATAEHAQVGMGPVRLAFPRSLQIPEGSPFVGRARELERLWARWRHVCDGTRSVVVMGGEAGIGKTRLASELARDVHEQGALVLYGRCDEGLAVPYQPFVEALRPYARTVGLDRLRAELGPLAPELRRLWPEFAGLGAPISDDPEAARFALFEAVAALMEAMTSDRRALLVLDDLHWAAPPTVLLLRHLIRCDRTLGGLVLCAYRDTELDPGQPFAQLLADLHRDASAERLSIRGLNGAAIAALVEATGHALDSTPELARVLGAQTAGNPFFLRELLVHAAASSTISSDGGPSDTSVAAKQLEAPEGLRHVIGQRVSRLSGAAGQVLRAAAVAGPTFSFVLLERVLDERSEVLDALEEAVAAGLLAEAGHDKYVFAHALVRQTIYGQLGSARRLRLHRQIGEALEASDDHDAHVEALAHHFTQAAADGQAAKAADYALAAGRSATARLGYEEAAAHYERGLQALDVSRQPQEQRQYELLLALGRARWGAGELDAARQACGQAAQLAETLGDANALARAALGFCGPIRIDVAAWLTRPVVELLERALAALDADDSALRARLLGRLAGVRAYGAYAGVEQAKPALAHKALEMARRVVDKAALADVLASTHEAIFGPDNLYESLALDHELERLSDDVRYAGMRALAQWLALDRLLELGDIDAVERGLDVLQRTADRRARSFRYALAVSRANHAFLQGRLEDYETLAHDALAHRFKDHDDTAAQLIGVQRVYVRREQGRLEEVVQMAEESVARYPRFVNWRCALASIYAQLGRSVRARRELEALARADFEDLPRNRCWLWNLSVLSEVAVLLGDAPRAQLLYRLLLPYADRCVVNGALLSEGSASRPLGRLATTLSQVDDAARHFEQALKMNNQIRSPLWVAHTQHDYAHMLLLRNRRGDRAKALELLDDALVAAEALGLKALADKTRPLKLAAEAAGRPLAAGRHSVS
jgi:DNA-binding SARP family transcriptional activator